MESVIKHIINTCSAVVQTYFRVNPNEVPSYPYAVFTYQESGIEWEQDGCYIDIDLFDNQGTDDSRIEATLNQLKNIMKHHSVMLDDCYLRFQFSGANIIDTMSDTLQRRNIRLYLIIDWRN
ncbi:hypothetical protein [Streptococcus equi]|uniref:DUF3168 domain-containing protein n=1 Tax=Streptococcus equi subsp. ruminatorum TaxID=254358 RepID=A0A6M1KY17_9STRE|nr:hypothetical protein [Streptococcus equi]NGL84155.1 hypothetical protein [Streptococcus equi subsp. ruminatorum]